MILSVYLTTVTDLNMLARGPGPEAEAELGAACCPVLSCWRTQLCFLPAPLSAEQLLQSTWCSQV